MSGQKGKGEPGGITFNVKEIAQALDTAPVIFIDGAHGLSSDGNFVKINLFQDRQLSMPPDGNPVARVVCARLVMTVPMFYSLAKWMAEGAEHVRQAKEAADDGDSGKQ